MWITKSVALLYVTIVESVAVFFGTETDTVCIWYTKWFNAALWIFPENALGDGPEFRWGWLFWRVIIYGFFMRNVLKWIRTQILFMLKSPFGSFFDVELFQFYQIRLSSSLYIFRLYKLTVFTVIHFYTFLYRFKRVQTVIWIDFKRKTGI